MGTGVDPYIADNLWRMLGERHWSQVELARRSGVSVDVIRTLCSMRGGTSVGNLRKIRRALRCTWDDLLE